MKGTQLRSTRTRYTQAIGLKRKGGGVGLLSGVRSCGVRHDRCATFAMESLGNRGALCCRFVGQSNRVGDEVDVARDVAIQTSAVLIGCGVGSGQMAVSQGGSIGRGYRMRGRWAAVRLGRRGTTRDKQGGDNAAKHWHPKAGASQNRKRPSHEVIEADGVKSTISLWYGIWRIRPEFHQNICDLTRRRRAACRAHQT